MRENIEQFYKYLEMFDDKQPNFGHLASVYKSLFKLRPFEKLNEYIIYLYNVSRGNDSFFKENGKEVWFTVFHKSIRQSDFFDGITVEREKALLTPEELKEYRYLRHKYIENPKLKRGENELFTDEYRHYLDLWQLKRREKLEESASGHMDSILWNAIHLDKNGLLFNSFEAMFDDFDDGILKTE